MSKKMNKTTGLSRRAVLKGAAGLAGAAAGSGAITGFACLHSPAWVELGPLYRFCLNHVLLPAEDQAAHRLEHVNVAAAPGRRPRLTQVGL